VNLTAAPAAGWSVSSWLGTNNDASTSTGNAVTMTAQNHSAGVNYQQDSEPPPDYFSFIPFVIDGFNP
jgi:hypothetical protein